MKKLILKTVAITLACIIGLCGLLFGAFILFCPHVLGKVSNDLGNESAAAYFYKLQCDKTGSCNDIAQYIYTLPSNGDQAKIEKYSLKMIENEGFEDYTSGKGAQIFGSDLAAKEYFYQKSAVASFMVSTSETGDGDISKALNTCKIFVEKYGYTKANPFRILVMMKGDMNASQKYDALQALNGLPSQTGANLGYIIADTAEMLNPQ